MRKLTPPFLLLFGHAAVTVIMPSIKKNKNRLPTFKCNAQVIVLMDKRPSAIRVECT